MISKSKVGIKDSIAMKLLRTVFSFYVIFAIGVTVGHMVIEYNYQKNSINQDLKDIQRTFEEGLAVAMWQLNQEALQTVVKGMLEVPIIVGVEIQNENGQIIALGGVISHQGHAGNVGLHVNISGISDDDASIHDHIKNQFDIFKHSFPTYYTYKKKTRFLGEVTIYSSSTVIFRRVKLGFLMLIVNAILKTAALWFIFLFFATYMLRRPLAAFIAATTNVTLEKLATFKVKVKTTGRNELTILEESFNSMIGSLHQSVEEREQAEEALRESEYKFRSFSDQSIVGIYLLNDGVFKYVNPKFAEIFGYTVGECLENLPFKNLVYTEDIALVEEQVDKRLKEETNSIHYEFRGKKKNGEIITIEIFGSSIVVNDRRAAIGTLLDITGRKKAEDQIKANLKEKEVLIDEIHHRVKNNMNVISSLLRLQANGIEDGRIKDILKESQNRVYAMSAIHETLHGSENLSEINLKKYLSKITTSIFQSSSVNQRKVKLKNNIKEIPININQASPLGLIINELISNSLKYAFPDEEEGEINVSLKKQDNQLELTIKDDGIGIPNGFDWKGSNTLGLKLVRTLVENQLDGSIDMESKNGTKFIIKFNIET